MSAPNSTETSPSLMAQFLGGITELCVTRPRLTLLWVTVSVVLCLLYSAYSLKFKTDRSDLIDPQMAFHQRWLRYTESFGEPNDLVVAVEADSPTAIEQTLDSLGEQLKERSDLYGKVFYKVDPGNLQSKGLQYLPPAVLEAGLARLDEYSSVLSGRWDLVRLDVLLARIGDRLAITPDQATPRVWEHADRLTESLTRFAGSKSDFVNPWPDILPVDRSLVEQPPQSVYVMNDAKTMGFLMTTPTKEGQQGFDGATQAIDLLRQMIQQAESQSPGTRISLTGIPVLENDEMRRSQLDSTHASVIAFVGVAMIFFVGLRGVLHPAIGMLVLAVGMVWSFGLTTLIVGHLNILSVSFASIVIGLGNDFAIHILSRYLDLRHHGQDVRSALVETSRTLGPGIVTGAVTTALAFFCASLTSFLGVAELGLIAGGGILLCTVATFTCLPALVAVADRNRREQALPVPFQGKWLRQATSRYPGRILILSVLILSVVGWKSFDWSETLQQGSLPKPLLQYDHNLLNLQAQGLESVEAQKRIFESSGNSLLYAISLADSPEEARRRKDQLEALPSVHHVEELASRLPAIPASVNQPLIERFQTLLAALPAQPPELTGAISTNTHEALVKLYQFVQSSTEPEARSIERNLRQLLARIDALEIRGQMALFTEFEYRLRYALLAQFQSLHAVSNPEPVTLGDFPEDLRSRYVGSDGKWLLQIFPNSSVWDMEPLNQFVKELRSVDPNVTGTPLQNFEAAIQIKQSYEICSIYSLIVILVVLLIDFLEKSMLIQTFIPALITTGIVLVECAISQSSVPILPLAALAAGMIFFAGVITDRAAVIDTVSAIIPPAIGMLMMFGILTICGIPLNPANLIILPLIIGIGVDNGVHVLHDFHSKPNEVYSPSPSMVNAITLTQTTSMVGFGSMMISAHRGLHSLGIVLTIGVACCVFMTLVTLPAFLAWISRFRSQAESVALATHESPVSPLDPTSRSDRPNDDH